MNKIEEILQKNRDIVTIKGTIEKFVSHPIKLAHTHHMIWSICKSVGQGKYGEIGSHSGNSAICAATANPDLSIHCFDLPNARFGGIKGSEIILQKAMDTFAPNRHSIVLADSQTDSTRNQIRQSGPYVVTLVDGHHGDREARFDMDTFWPVLETGGIMIMDDLYHHKSLLGVWNQFVKDVNPQEHLEILDLSQDEIDNGYVRRGVGILIK